MGSGFGVGAAGPADPRRLQHRNPGVASAKKAFDTALEKAIDTNKKRGLELYQAVPPSLEQLAH